MIKIRIGKIVLNELLTKGTKIGNNRCVLGFSKKQEFELISSNVTENNLELYFQSKKFPVRDVMVAYKKGD